MRATVALLLSAEERLKVQRGLERLDETLARLQRAPGRRRQSIAESSLKALERTLEKFEAALTLVQRKNLAEIKAYRFFSRRMLAAVDGALSAGMAAPTRELLNTVIDDRAGFLAALRVLQAHFDTIEEFSAWSCATLAY